MWRDAIEPEHISLALGLVAMLLWLIVLSIGGAFALMRIAGG